MNLLERLLGNSTVEWIQLDQLIKVITPPTKLKKESYKNTGDIPIIDQGIDLIAGYTDKNTPFIENDKYIIFGDHTEHIKYVDFPFVQGADGIKIMKPKHGNAKYIYYAFQNFYNKELNYKRHWSNARKTLIPIPCPNNPEKSLTIQNKIANILDKYTKLTTKLIAELTKQLIIQKKQYLYYCDQLTKLKKEIVKWKKLEDIAEIYGGLTGKNKSDFKDGNASFIPYKNIFKNIEVDFSDLQPVNISSHENQNKVEYGDILFTSSSETVHEVGMSSSVTTPCETPIYLNSFSFGVRFKKQLHLIPEFSKFLFRTSHMRSEILKTASGVTRFNISKERFKKILVPIPYPNNPDKSFNIQSDIARILDNFTKLTSELTAELTTELTTRKKQYEYYRDLLFSFQKP